MQKMELNIGAGNHFQSLKTGDSVFSNKLFPPKNSPFKVNTDTLLITNIQKKNDTKPWKIS